MPDVLPGDRVTVGTTHQVRIDRQDCWVKVEVNTAVQDGEDGETAIKRASKIVARNVVTEIERQAEVIVEANKSQKA